jgi:hypothetical protein
MPDRLLFLAELYRPGCTATTAAAMVRRLRAAVEARAEVTLIESIYLPHDELLLCMIGAGGPDLVADAAAAAGLSFDRISPAVGVGATLG